MAQKKVKVTLIKSPLGRKPNQRRTVKALGLKKLQSSIVKQARPEIMGMINTVSHLVRVEEVKNG